MSFTKAELLAAADRAAHYRPAHGYEWYDLPPHKNVLNDRFQQAARYVKYREHS